MSVLLPPELQPYAEQIGSGWVEVEGKFTEESAHWFAAMTSPAAVISAQTQKSAAGAIKLETVRLLIRATLDSELRLATMLRAGLIDMAEVEALLLFLRGFSQACAADAEMRCQTETCEWRGPVSKFGPLAVCPQCGGEGRFTPKLALARSMPPMPNGRGAV